MKNTVIVLLVVALIVLVIGAVNQHQRVDLDYVFGTWNGVSVFALAAVVAAATVVVGLAVAAMARVGAVADRRKLERELEQVYPRLREAEKAAGLPEWQPVSSNQAADSRGSAAEAAADDAPVAEAASDDGPVAASAAVSPGVVEPTADQRAVEGDGAAASGPPPAGPTDDHPEQAEG